MALKGIKVIEMAGLAPAPYCGMLLSDFGARVVRVDRARAPNPDRLSRGKLSMAVDLKNKDGCRVVRKLCSKADVLIEPFRPGVMEKLGLGPKDLCAENPGLIYARLSGYGQSGPLSKRAGHDINYLAISGLLSRLGRKNERPLPPINLLADFAGGGLMCAFGILLALFERTRSGRGQVIDANMVEGAAYVGSFVYQMLDSPIFTEKCGEGWLDSGSPFYNTYTTKDNKYMAVGAIETQFYDNLLKGLGLTHQEAEQFGSWNVVSSLIRDKFASKTQKEWCEIFDNVDACVTPILEVPEALDYHHNVERGSFSKALVAAEAGGRGVPDPAPKLDRTPGETNNRYPDIGEHTIELLREAGCSEEECKKLVGEGAVEVSQKSKL